MGDLGDILHNIMAYIKSYISSKYYKKIKGGEKKMRTYKQLKEDFEIVNEINSRQAETLQTISNILANRNEEIAKLKIENRYMQRKISEYENFLDKNKNLLVKYNTK